MHRRGKPVLGVDLDDVILDFNESLQAFHNSRFGTSVRREDVVTYDIEKIWGCSAEEASRRIFDFCRSDEHSMASPVSGAFEGVRHLGKSHELNVISSRGDQVKDPTLRWIRKHFDGHFASIVLTNQYFGLPEKVRSKADVCRELGVGVMIEDSMSQAKEIAASGCRVLLLDCPWNQGDLPENVTRIYSWKEIVAHLR
jgi:hypothetical protein